MKNVLFLIILVPQLNLFANEENALSLQKIVQKSLEHNFDIKILEHKTLESKERYNQTFGNFDWGLMMNFKNNIQNTPVSSTLDTLGNASSVITKTNTQSLTIKKKFTTGTEISIPYTYNIVDSDSSYRTFKITHEPSVGITLKQPVFRTFISDYFTKENKVSELDYNSSLFSQKNEIESSIYNVLKKVFQYKESEKNLELFKTSMETSSKNLDFVRKKKELGSGSVIDVLESETSFYKSKERYLNQKLVQEKLYRQLKIDLGYSTEEKIEFKNIEDEINYKEIVISKELFIKNALENRGDYLSQKYKVDIQKLNERIASLEYLPNVNIEGQYTSKAVSDSINKANRDLSEGKFVSTNLGLSINYNLLQRSEKASKRLNQIKLEKENLKIKQMLNDLRLEIEMAIENFITQKEIVNSFSKSVEMENTKWQYYQRQFKNGEISSFELAKFQEMKEQIFIKFYQAKYKLAQNYFQLYKVQGKLLERVN